MLQLIIQVFYWLALSTWFGGVLSVVVAAPIIFRTVSQYNPTLPTVLSVNLENQHGTLLAGSIVGNLVRTLVNVELVCAIVLLLTLLGQWFFIDRSGPSLISGILRSALYVAAMGLVLYDWRFVWPRAWKYRQEYIDHADEPDVANPAKEQFDRYQAESVTILQILLFVLLGMILFSAGIQTHSSMTYTFGR
jgi:hypothetical protein